MKNMDIIKIIWYCKQKKGEKNNMSKIGELINNIYLYGNSKFYIGVPNSLLVYAIEFLVDEEGNLQITKSMEEFYTSFWQGNAILRESIEVCKYMEEDMGLAICPIVYKSPEGKTALTHEKTSPKANTDKAVKEIYQIVVKMLHLSNADITSWIKSDTNGKQNILLAKVSQERTLQEVIPKIAHENIEAMLDVTKGRIESISMIWNRVQTIYSKEDFKAASELWSDLCEDEEIPEFLVLKQARKG